MYQKDRLDMITEILKKYKYVTVKYLVDTLHYSNATINRDLNVLLKQNIVKRSYGGVELVKTNVVPRKFRYHKMKIEKNKIGKMAASLVENGDTIFIDDSTTAQFMEQYLIEKENITVITNNMDLVAFLCKYGIKVICLGGTAVNNLNILHGNLTIENAMKFKADKFFFATIGCSLQGEILINEDTTTEIYHLLQTVMIENANKSIYLVDHDKIESGNKKVLANFNDVDYVISDYKFSEDLKKKFANTEFICV